MIAIASRVMFGFAGVTLVVYAAALIVLSLVEAVRAEGSILFAVLDSISTVVIAIAVFDVAKYLLEEEVVREREMRQAGEARRSLTRFVATVIIAVLLEALVVLFKTARSEVSNLIYPAAMVLVGGLLIVFLGLYIRLSASVEREAGEQGDAEPTNE